MHAPWSEPFARFATLLKQAEKAQPKDPNQLWLATVDPSGQPQVRVVLLKLFDERGFVFFTNYESAKGQALEATPKAAACFYWPAIDQQVRIEGSVGRTGEAESDSYFSSRARGSQLGAWASQQSHLLDSRASLETALKDVTKRFEGQQVPRPPNWGGYRLSPQRIEFWRAHPDRLHWRELFVASADKRWLVQSLNP